MDWVKQKQVSEHFERMYQKGQKPWTEHGTEPALDYFLDFLKEKYARKAKILDTGCGDGWITIKAAQKGFQAWGIDSSETAIFEAKQKALKAKVSTKTHFEVGNALNLPYRNNFFGAGIDRGLFHHILPINYIIYFENILRVQKLKGFLYLTVFSQKNTLGIGHLFTHDSIKKLFGKYFSITYFQQDPYPTTAPAHLLHFILERK